MGIYSLIFNKIALCSAKRLKLAVSEIHLLQSPENYFFSLLLNRLDNFGASQDVRALYKQFFHRFVFVMLFFLSLRLV